MTADSVTLSREDAEKIAEILERAELVVDHSDTDLRGQNLTEVVYQVPKHIFSQLKYVIDAETRRLIAILKGSTRTEK